MRFQLFAVAAVEYFRKIIAVLETVDIVFAVFTLRPYYQPD